MSEDPTNAETLFDEYLELCGSNKTLHFDDWVKQHGSHETELRALYSMDQRFAARLNQALPEKLVGENTFFHRASGRSVTDEPSHLKKPARAGDVMGKFRLLHVLGTGGVGQVWKAEHVDTGAEVAIKLLLPDRTNHRSLLRFAREGRAGQRISHPSIVDVLEVGESDGTPWICQELVTDGRTLRDFIEEMRKAPDLPADYYFRVASFCAMLADALEAAHQQGVIHRDIKPQNILVDPKDNPRITDFGLARISDEPLITLTGDFAGTLLYMSPEQVAAGRMGIDHRCDIFSLGVVLFELLSLRRPFEGDTTHQLAEKILTWDPPTLTQLRSKIPKPLALIVDKALEKKPDARYQCMAELAEDIRRFLANESIQAKAPSSIRRAKKWFWRHPTLAPVTAVGVVALCISGTLLAQSMRQGRSLEQANETLTLQKSAIEESASDLERKNKELKQANKQIKTEKDRVEEERERLETSSEFQAEFFENLEPEEFGTQLESRLSEALASSLREHGKTEAQVERSVGELRKSIAPINFTTLGSDLIASTILDPANESAGETFGRDPRLALVFRKSITDTYIKLSFRESIVDTLDADHMRVAMGMIRAAHEANLKLRGIDHEDTFWSGVTLGAGLLHLGHTEEARLHSERSIELGTTLFQLEDSTSPYPFGRPFADWLRDMFGNEFCNYGDPTTGLEYLEEAYSNIELKLGSDSEEALEALGSLGRALSEYGDSQRAVLLLEEGLQRSVSLVGHNDPLTISMVGDLGLAKQAVGDLEAAETLLRDYSVRTRRKYGEEHEDTLFAMGKLAAILKERGENDEALTILEDRYNALVRLHGEQHLEIADPAYDLGLHLSDTGAFAESAPHLTRSLFMFRNKLGAAHPIALLCAFHTIYALQESGQQDRAKALRSECLRGSRMNFVDRNSRTVKATASLRVLLTEMGETEALKVLLSEHK